MFKIGDKVAYPLHGAGTIEKIDDKNMLGEIQKYYTIIFPDSVKVMLPVTTSEELGLRPIVSREEAIEILKILKDLDIEEIDNWTDRYAENAKKMHIGNLSEISQIYKELSFRNRERNLSTSEKKMLLTARQVVISELSLAIGIDYNTLLDTLEKKYRYDN